LQPALRCPALLRGASFAICCMSAILISQVVDFTASSRQQGRAAGQQQAAGQPAEADVEAQRDEERFAGLRRKAGKLARQERRTLAAKGDAAPQPRGFS
jgi:hypothetical protein